MPANDRKLTMDELGRMAPETYASAPRRPVVVLLDDVRSRHNVGSIFRTADSFGIERIVLCGFTPQPPHREIEKTALGATLSVPWSHSPTCVEAVAELQRQGYRVLAVEQTAQAEPIDRLAGNAADRLALVFGNELEGVSDAVVRQVDGCVVIPQHGSKHSMNVSVCAGVVLWWVAGRH
ncbi:MAG: TrmH family RNA methyltransferase [Flavobacteriales bacterium]|nr:TrmH family RNA methyltransferase [Flavobacteriales bacterium]